MMEGSKFLIRKRLLSFKYAFQGLKTLFLTEHNSRIHAVFALIAILLGAYFHISACSWVAILFAIAFVFVAELFNSAIERLTDLISPGLHPLAKTAKDFAAAAVLIAACNALVIAAIVFIPPILKMLP